MNGVLLIAASVFAFTGVAFLVSWVLSEIRELPTLEIYERLENRKPFKDEPAGNFLEGSNVTHEPLPHDEEVRFVRGHS